jgi:hypothetical protein
VACTGSCNVRSFICFQFGTAEPDWSSPVQSTAGAVEGFFLFAKPYTPALGPTRSTVHWVPGVLASRWDLGPT